MNAQGRIDTWTRKSSTRRRETRLSKKIILAENDKAFVHSELVTVEEQEPKPIRKSTRTTQKKQVQTTLPFDTIENADKKRKTAPEQLVTNKKQRTNGDATEQTEKTISKHEEVEQSIEAPISVERKESDFELKNTVVEDVTTQVDNVKNFDNTNLKESCTSHLLSPPHQDSFEERIRNSAIADRHRLEPTTPPNTQSPSLDAPLRTFVSAADKLRIEGEQKTLEKVQKALDIILTDRASRSVPALYSQIESPLRNSTKRSITLSHVRKVMYIAPRLYSMQTKEIRRFGNKSCEDYLIEFEKEWVLPLIPKDYELRRDLLHNGLKEYFKLHTEPDATVPEATLPKLNTLIDKKEWIKEAKLPPGVKSLLEAHEKVKEEKIESEKPKPTPKGNVKDRMAALRARLAQKK